MGTDLRFPVISRECTRITSLAAFADILAKMRYVQHMFSRNFNVVSITRSACNSKRLGLQSTLVATFSVSFIRSAMFQTQVPVRGHTQAIGSIAESICSPCKLGYRIWQSHRLSKTWPRTHFTPPCPNSFLHPPQPTSMLSSSLADD